MTDPIDFAAERSKREDQPDAAHRYVDEAGVEWFTFLIEWHVDGEAFTAELWAKDAADAERRFEALKSTGQIQGQIFSTVTL